MSEKKDTLPVHHGRKTVAVSSPKEAAKVAEDQAEEQKKKFPTLEERADAARKSKPASHPAPKAKRR